MDKLIQFFLIDHIGATGIVMLLITVPLKIMAHRSGAFKE